MKKPTSPDLPIIQATYDLIKWYVPILNRLPRDQKYGLGGRIIENLYDILESLILARYASEKETKLEATMGKVDILRYQTRLLADFQLIDTRRYEYVSEKIDEIGRQLTGWLNQQRRKS